MRNLTFHGSMKKTDFQKSLGRHIARLRKEKGLTQVEFGYLIEMEKQNVNRLEAGRTNPTAYTLYKIAAALEVTLSQMVDFE